MQNIGFSDSGYIIKPPQPSSTIYGAPPFTGHQYFVFLYFLDGLHVTHCYSNTVAVQPFIAVKCVLMI